MTLTGNILVLLGAAFVLLAAVGIFRFPDVLTRASASTKAAGLGVALVLAGAAFLFGTTEAAVKLTLAVLLQFATAPVSGHVIGRAAYRSGAPLWEGTHTDELHDYYAARDAEHRDVVTARGAAVRAEGARPAADPTGVATSQGPPPPGPGDDPGADDPRRDPGDPSSDVGDPGAGDASPSAGRACDPPASPES